MDASNLTEVGRPEESRGPRAVSKHTQRKARRPTARAVQKRKKAKPAGLSRKATSSRAKSEKLVCRYCGSDDLAPSFIQRRDRRCRKCFSKRYGTAGRAKKTKVKKK